jgi:hypothetical protein
MSELHQKLENLRNELEGLQSEIKITEEKNELYTGGLVKSLIEARLETQKISESIIHQRILCLEAEIAGLPILDYQVISVPSSEPNLELANNLFQELVTQQTEIETAQKDADLYTGGLVHSMKLAAVSTKEQTFAMLQQRYYVAKYGLAFTANSNSKNSSNGITGHDQIRISNSHQSNIDPGVGIIDTRIISKRYDKADYEEHIWCDFEHRAIGLEKPTRAIKGVLRFNDLFGETQLSLNWTVDHDVNPDQVFASRGVGFEYSKYDSAHKWVNSKNVRDIAMEFIVTNIIYQDGTRIDYTQ